MKTRIFSMVIMVCLLAAFAFLPQSATAEEPGRFVPDKALCAKMIRFGKQAYDRGKYLDAKEYFRKAVQADPMNQTAWEHYDMAIVFGLAEKVEKNTDLVAPDSSTRERSSTGAVAPTPPPPAPTAPEKKGAAQIEEEEGC
ncbi:hypothetical protein ACFL7E_08875 [Thermodesulfobacteriota bacterium]